MRKQPDNKPQIDRFKEAARELETDDREANFDRLLKRIAERPSKFVGNESPPTKTGGDSQK